MTRTEYNWQMPWRIAAAATVIAVASYGLWVAAAADDTDGPSIWTILAAAAFWIAVIVLVVLVVRVVLRFARSRRE